MYTVLLVDDELPILETLRNSIPWQQFGIDSLLTAMDGAQAWELIQARPVKLLITDIRMPHMDGMALLERVRSSYPDIHCILLTAYGEFEYARAAIKLGVENYLLKPFHKEEMEETIEKALDNIYTHRKNSDRLFRNNILLRWASGSITPEELSERAGLLNINTWLPAYCTVCIRRKSRTGSLAAYRADCEARLAGDYEVYRFRDEKERSFFILGGSGLTQEALRSILSALAEESGTAPITVLAIGTIVQDSDSLPQSYQSVLSLLETADLSAPGMTVLTAGFSSALENDPLSRELAALFSLPTEEARSEGYQALAARLEDASLNSPSVRPMSELANSLYLLFSREFPNQPGIREQLTSRLRLLPDTSGREALTQAVTELLEYSYLLFRYHFEQFSPVIQHAIAYIHRHFSDSLSIKEFCVKNKMSTNYLGFLFKKETGMFFNNYLTQYRICRSIRLLRDTDKKINEIAVKCGFSSTSYYISCFKKQTGLSPIKYRALEFNKTY